MIVNDINMKFLVVVIPPSIYQFLFSSVFYPIKKLMSIYFLHFFFSSQFSKLTGVVLYTCIDVGGCGFPVSVNSTRIGMDVVPFSSDAPISVYAAEPMALHKTFTRKYTAPFTLHVSGSVHLYV